MKHEVAVGEAEATKTTHIIKETYSDPQSKILASDEERTEQLAAKENDGTTSRSRITNQGVDNLCFIDPWFYDV